MEHEIDRWISAASVVVEKEQRQKKKLFIYQSIYAPIITCGHELWVGIKVYGYKWLKVVSFAEWLGAPFGIR